MSDYQMTAEDLAIAVAYATAARVKLTPKQRDDLVYSLDNEGAGQITVNGRIVLLEVVHPEDY